MNKNRINVQIEKGTRLYNDKVYQFAKLCMALTKQGFHFTRDKNVPFALTFEEYDARHLCSDFTKTPFVNGFVHIYSNKRFSCYQFDQWAGRC